MAIKGISITITYTAWNTSTQQPETGDVANHTLMVLKDGAPASPTNAPSEVVNGAYSLVLTSTEMTCDTIEVNGVSSTSGVIIIPWKCTTEHGEVAAIYGKLPSGIIAKQGDQMDLVNVPNATAVTAIQSGLSKPGTAQTIDQTTALPSNPTPGTIGWALQLVGADQYTDETTDPTQWHCVYTVSGSGAPGTGVTLATKKLWDTSGAKVTANTQVIGQANQ